MIRIEVWGEFASFNRPELKVERYSYDFITPSAARNILQSIYWHPAFDWVIDRIYILNPIKRMSIKRNELADKGSILEMTRYAAGNIDAPHLPIVQTQRSASVLKDVRYVIEAHFVPTGKEDFDAKKIYAITTERAKKGQCFRMPYLGCREFTCQFRLVGNDEEIKTEDLNMNCGIMLYDLDYSGEKVKSYYFNANVVHGVVDLNNCEVYR